MNPMAREQDRSRFNRAQNPGGMGRSRQNGFGDSSGQNGSRYGSSRPQNGDRGARDRSRSRQGGGGNGVKDYGNGRPSRFDAPPPSVASSSVRENGRFSRFSDSKPAAAPSAEANGGWNGNSGSYNGSNSTSMTTTHARREGGSRFSAAAPQSNNHLKAYPNPRPLMSLN